MADVRRISVAALNIALHAPHPSAKYIELLSKAFKRREIIRVGSLHGLMLGTMYRPHEVGKQTLINGELYRFVKLDANEPWFDSLKKSPATKEDVQSIRIPSNLLPHLQRIPFVFESRRHRLWYVARDQKTALAPSVMEKFLKNLLQSTAHDSGFPEVEVTALPEKASVERILNLPRLEYLRIELVRPNPDNAQSAEARWLKKLELQKSNKARLELFHEKNSHLKPNAETRDMAKAATKNGLVIGRGRSSEGLVLEDSTKKRPLLQQEFVNSKTETVTDVLNRVATNGSASG